MLAKVLVVDDEPDVTVLCKVNLEFEGYTVWEAKDGQEALDLVRSDVPDLILLDVMMPRVDGWHVLEALGKDEALKKIPVVVLTAKVAEDDQIKGLTAGASDYITKPFNPQALITMVKSMLEGDPSEIERNRQQKLLKLKLLRDEQNTENGRGL